MIEYFDLLPEEEQQQLTEVIQTLLKQTFVLERKYEKRTGRFIFNREYRILSKHLEFLKEYFKIAGMEIVENIPSGVIYIRGEGIAPERLSKLATIYLLILKLIYDEQMASASTSINIYTTLGEINERVGSFNLLKDRPSLTEIKRTLVLLKKYQLVEVLDPLEELESETRIIIYPCINMVLLGEEVKHLLESFQEDTALENEQEEVFVANEVDETEIEEAETKEQEEEGTTDGDQ
ncbi:DUF4194 domain-containing protein [Roseburia sp. 499]|uniref:DUF4194 domain-containing protein n=1 Tax=Roseburia sp. 499 TaxID=1261634 RepID=UPI000950D218|nr:DUF4194 domain-containing protein [Roseburia sp. 499]WVK68471.1 DUF4194 domain-containing protein [Roseburia sp. 499]